MLYTIEYYTDSNGSIMVMDNFYANNLNEAFDNAYDLLKDYSGADYAYFWNEVDEDDIYCVKYWH